MVLDARLRSVLLIVALLATLAAVYWARGLEQDESGTAQVVTPASRSIPPRTVVDAPAMPVVQSEGERVRGLDLSRLQRAPSAQPSADLFGQPQIAVAAASRSARGSASSGEMPEAPPPPPPAPPPLPFTYLGQLVEAGRTMVFLSTGDRNHVVAPGEVIDNLYRIDEIGASAVVITYLPMNTQQTLLTGAVP